MEIKPDNDLSIDQVYGNYIDLYLHLDKFRWNLMIGIFSLFFGVLGIISQLFHDSTFFPSMLGIGFIFVACVVSLYNRFIQKFLAGQDYVCFVLSDLEERNRHIFANHVLSPREGKEFISFFNRRKQSILNNMSKHTKPDYKQSGLVNFRSSNITDIFLSRLSAICCFVGVLFILTNVFWYVVSILKLIHW